MLGHGSHPDPAGELAETLAELASAAVIAHVCGTNEDPQDAARQEATLREAGRDGGADERGGGAAGEAR